MSFYSNDKYKLLILIIVVVYKVFIRYKEVKNCKMIYWMYKFRIKLRDTIIRIINEITKYNRRD